MPLSGLSALATATIRPGTRRSRGRNSSVSTPSGTTRNWEASTPKSSAISAAEVEETVIRSGISRATRCCMPRNPYQRWTNALRRHGAAARSTARSRVIGWWMVATSGTRRAMSSSPEPRHWLSCTTSKSAARERNSRAARRLNVRGSGNPAVHIVPSSSRSMRSRISPGRGVRNGSESRYRSRLGTSVSFTRGSSSSG